MVSAGIFSVWRRVKRRPLLLTAGALLWLAAGVLTPQAAFAQTAQEEATGSAGSAGSAGPAMLVSKYATVPPLPFSGPQMGPIIDYSAQDDVDRRTTAFIPRDLSMLSPVDDAPSDDQKWIRVDLSEQLAVAYEGKNAVRGFVVSTGLPGTPTVTGTFHIRMKVRSQTMTGGDPSLGNYYNLPNVEWVQYFYEDYSFHGTYWHNNFGNPMSHGCVNMTNADAKWLWDWAGPKWDGETVWDAATKDDPGTLVIVTQ